MDWIEGASLALNSYANYQSVVKPKAAVKLNKKVVDWLTVSILSTGNRRADTFELVIPVLGQTNVEFDRLIDEELIEVEIDVDPGDGKFVRMFTGRVDSYTQDFVSEHATFVGRDLTGLLIDTLTTERFLDSTASEIASDFADEHSLKKDIWKTTVSVGAYNSRSDDGTQYSQVNTNKPQWDLLSYYADNEDYDLYVKGDTLVFKPKSDSKDYYNINWRDKSDSASHRVSKVIDIKFSRSLTIANDVRVTVQSFDPDLQTNVKVSATRRHMPNRSGARAAKQLYIKNVGGLTAEDAAKYAQSELHRLSKHEKIFNARMQGDTILNPRSVIKVNGFGSNWDQLYYPDSISRQISFLEEGFSMSVRAKNHDVNSQVIL